MTPTEFVSQWLHSPLADRIVVTLAHFLWQGSAIAVLVLAASALVGKRVQRRYAVSVGGLFLLAVCPIVTFFFISNGSQRGVNAPSHEAEVALDVATGTTEFDLAAPFAAADYSDDLAARSPNIARVPKEDLLSKASPWLLAAWLAGVGAFSLRLLLSQFSIAWLKGSGEPAGQMLREQARTLCAKLHVAAPAIRVSRRVAQAVAVGFFRPVIVVPAAWLIELPPECLEAILAHELAHIRRRDLWINLMQRILETLLFFHPAVWWLSQRLRSQREMCCDELAVSLTGRRVEYASTLELVARRRSATVAPALAAGIGGKKMALLNRVRNILGLAPATGGVGPWTLGAAAVIAAGGVWWIATGGSPLAAIAGDDDQSLVALADDDEGEREERGEGDREEGDREERGDREREEGDREEGERDRPREGKRERVGDRPRDGDRPREGDRPRDGDRPREGAREGDRPDRPSPEDFRRHIELMKRRVAALAEQGRREEAEALEREIYEAVRRFEGRPDLREIGEAVRRQGERPQPDVHPEVRAQLERLHRALNEAREAGREGQVRELEHAISAINERLRAQREGRGDRPELPPEVRERLEQLKRRHQELAEAGRRDAAQGVEREIRELLQRHAPRPDGRPHDGGPREGDRPRFEGPPPFRPDVPRPEGRPQDRELLEAIRALREEVGRLRQEVNQLKGARPPREGDRPHFEGDRPRFDAHPPIERDRPPRADGERDRPDRPREGDRPRERDGEREKAREGGDRDG